MKVVVGLGLHRPMSPAELAPLAAFHPLQHDADDTVPTAVIDGIPGAISRHLEGVDWSLSLGVGELHQYAGVSGGHKGVAVGLGGRATLGALHGRARVLQPGVRIGAIEGNPFRAAVDGLGAAARCRLALVFVPGPNVWLFGEPAAVTRATVARISPWAPTPRLYEGAVLRVPPAKASSFYQASRAAPDLALSPSPPVRDGGTLVLDAACPEGLGAEAGFRAALERSAPPWTELLTGPEPKGAGAQRGVILALLAQRYRLVVTGCEAPEALLAVGIPATRERPPSGPDWLEVSAPFTRIPQLVPASEPSPT